MGSINYAIEITIRGTTHRYATKRLTATRDIGCETRIVSYQPQIISIDPGKSSIEFDDAPKIPSFKVDVLDLSRFLIDQFEDDIYETAEVNIIELDADDEILYESLGYMTDVSWEEGVISFSVRLDESRVQSKFGKPFSFDSFQYFNILMPKRVDVVQEYTANEKTPWEVYRTEMRRLTLAKQIMSNDFLSYATASHKLTGVGGHVHPDVPWIKLNPHPDDTVYSLGDNPQYKYYKEVDTEADATYDGYSVTEGFVAGNEKTIATQLATLFEDTGGTSYQKAFLGNSEDRGEIIKYGYCRMNQVYDPDTDSFVTMDNTLGNFFYLSAIPTSSEQHPLRNSFSLSASEKNDLEDNYSVSRIHKRNQICAPYDQHDYIWVKANGLEPSGFNDPEVSSNLLYSGRTYESAITGKKFKALSRYKIVDPHENTAEAPIGTYALFNVYDQDTEDHSTIDTLLKLEMHNRAQTDFDTGNYPHELGTALQAASWELSNDLDSNDQLMIHKFTYSISYIDVHLMNIDSDARSELIDAAKFGYRPLKDRYRGLRIDTFEDFSAFVQKIYESYNNDGTVDQAEKINLSLINNATEKFAICIGSEVMTEEFTNPSGTFDVPFERLYFSLSENRPTNEEQLRLEVESDSTEAEAKVETLREPDTYFLNNLKVHHNAINVGELENQIDVYGTNAEQYFLKQRYRVIHDPVPENAQDLGRLFPIVYGAVDRVPMIQAISKKTFGSDSATAGDDTYVFASHPTDVKDPTDIQIWLYGDEVDNDGNRQVVTGENFSAAVQSSVIKSPFPNVVDSHHQFNGSTLEFKGALYNPYHRLTTKRTLDGDLVYCVKLRGDEWDEKSDRFDARYPIRNGVGNSVLYASFGGWVDRDGQLIEHPCDVLEHFVRTYGVQPYASNFINSENLEAIKSLTRRHRASVFIDGRNIGNDERRADAVEEFIQQMSLQFGLPYYLDNSTANFTLPDSDFVNYSKPISEGYNLLEGVAQESTGYAEVYTRIVYKYQYNYVSEKFDKKIVLDADNNPNCAKAARARGQKEEFQIEAFFVRDAATAREVALRYAKALTRRQTLFSCRVRYVDNVIHAPGDVVPMTYDRFGLDQSSVLVLEVKREPNAAELIVLKL